MSLRTALRDVTTIRTLLTTAEDEARRGGDELPGAEHLVLAAAALPDGSAARALAAVGVDVGTLRGAIEAVHAEALGASPDSPGTDQVPLEVAVAGPASGVFRCTATARQVFQQASGVARAPGSGGLQGRHVVAAACDLTRGTFVRALDRLGVDRSRLRDAAATQGAGR
ncbi:Clp protease N-terminal domain-containing protein [Aquipuribacter sp. MA13-6]|uniref:Clp protease N-terminal domain-containing protein n=1 Tax=unclassified Aquipuribacter TaxID=2635084 RepID=UPI003EEAAEA9